MIYTITQIKSLTNGKVYAEAGEEIRLLTEHGNVLIVQNVSTGEKFPVLAEKVTHDANHIQKPAEPEPKPQSEAMAHRPHDKLRTQKRPVVKSGNIQNGSLF